MVHPSTSDDRWFGSHQNVPETRPVNQTLRGSVASPAFTSTAAASPDTSRPSPPSPDTNTPYKPASPDTSLDSATRKPKIKASADPILSSGPSGGHERNWRQAWRRWLSPRLPAVKVHDAEQDEEEMVGTRDVLKSSKNADHKDGVNKASDRELESSPDHALTSSGGGVTCLGASHSDPTTNPSPLDNEATTRKRNSGNAVQLRTLKEGIDMGKVRLNPNSDQIFGPDSKPTPESGKSTRRNVGLAGLLAGTTLLRNARVKEPKKSPASLEYKRQCRAEIMDNKNDWHKCFAMLDNWCDRDLISLALILPILKEGKVQLYKDPKNDVLHNWIFPEGYPLEYYVELDIRLQHLKEKDIGKKHFYVIPTMEESFIVFGNASLNEHGIVSDELPKHEDGSYLKFASPQFNMGGVLKHEKGKHASTRDEESVRKSKAPYEEREKKIQAERDAENAAQAAREVNYGSSTSTQTTWSTGSTGWHSNAAASSQPTGTGTDDDYLQRASNSQHYQQSPYGQYQSTDTGYPQNQAANVSANGDQGGNSNSSHQNTYRSNGR